MSDLKGTPGGEAGQVNAYYHDDGNGTHDEAKAAHLRGWDATDLQWYRLGVDHATGAVKMYLVNGGSGGTSAIDGAAYTAYTTVGTPAMVARDDTAPASLAENTVGIARSTLWRAMHVNLRDASGNEVAVGGGTQYIEGAASASLTGTVALWKDAANAVTAVSASKPLPTSLVHGIALAGTSSVSLVNSVAQGAAGAAPWPVTIPGSSLTFGGTVSLGGPVSVLQNTSPWLVSLATVPTHAVTQSGAWFDTASLAAGTATIGDVNLTASARGGYNPFLVSALTGSLSVSASPGKFGGCVLINLNSAPAYLQVFDQGAGSNVSLGSTAPTFSIPIPANGTSANGAAIVVPLDVGLKINNGIKVAATTALAGGATVATGLSGFIYYI